MNKCKRKVHWIVLLSLCHCVFAETSTETAPNAKEELAVAEAKDRLEIIKTIKKINNDGSYTIGYEADDGSFKIESRDVLGNIKGTYGYVDEGGEIKRVSYNSRNMSDLIAETPSVVQRIPKTNDKVTTKAPSILLYNPTTVPAQTSTTLSSTTTSATTVSGPTRFIHFPQRSLLKTTLAPRAEAQKSEGQIIRPEISTARPTEVPLSKRTNLHHHANEKPVTEEPEAKASNLLRRQLPQEFDAQQHIAHFQQSLGEDSVDVYSGSHTGRTLFTTTIRPKAFSTTHHSIKPSIPQSTTEIVTKENVISEATSSPPAQAVYQIEQAPHQLVAVRHPYPSSVVLMPYHQVQPQPQYFIPNPHYVRQVVPNPTQYPENPQIVTPVYVQRPPIMRHIPVETNENQYSQQIRDIHSVPQNGINEVSNEVDNIKPPVSIRDFQKLIELLIVRQARLEQVNALLFAQLNSRPTPSPTFVVRRPQVEQPRYIIQSPQQNQYQDNVEEYTSTATSYAPTRRVPRLLRSKPPPDEAPLDEDGDYLPSQIREMLLLRMLQLAINPSLPIPPAVTEEQDGSTPHPQYVKRPGARNVEILGEEEEDEEENHLPNKRRKIWF